MGNNCGDLSGNKLNKDNCCELKSKLLNSDNLAQKGEIIFQFWYTNRAKHFQAFEDIINDLINEAKEKDGASTLGWCYFVIGWLRHDNNLLPDGLEAFRKAQKYFAKAENKEGFARALNGEAAISMLCGKYGKSLEKYSEALDIAEDQQIDNLISAISSNIGGLFYELKLYSDALGYFKRALSLENKFSLNKVFQQTNIGCVYTCLGEYGLAEENILAALRLCREIKNKYFEPDILLNLALLRHAQEREVEARECLQQTVSLASKLKNKRLKALALLELGLIEREADNLKGALALLLEVLEVFKEIQQTNYEARTLTALAEIYKKLGKFAKAFEASQAAIELETQIFNDEMVNIMGVKKVKEVRRENMLYKKLYQQINLLAQIGQALTASLDRQEVAKITFEYLADLLKIENLFIGLFAEDEKNILNLIVLGKNGAASLVKMSLKDEIIKDLRFLSNNYSQDNIVSDNYAKNKFTKAFRKLFSLKKDNDLLLAVPLNIKNMNLGFCLAQGNEKDVYTRYHRDIFRAVTSYLAIALYNAQLFGNVKKLAFLDPLTGLLNRRSILERAHSEFLTCQRLANPLSIAIFDIDKFKSINDNHGHGLGDKVLKGLTSIIRKMIRGNDLFGRLGGDEFLLVLPHTAISDALLIVERLRRRVSEEKFPGEERDLKASISLGVTGAMNGDMSVADVINRADLALYEAKRKGGNIVCRG